jgi:hypothetical protein
MTMKRLTILFVCAALAFVPTAVLSQNKVYRTVTNDGLEKILQSLDLKYQKDERKDKDATITYFDFKRGDHAYRLYNYVNDLWIESTFEKAMKADDINRWNSDAKFSRLVMIPQRDKTMLSLESQLDCLGGVTDAVVKQYINRFDEEAKKFAKFSSK